MTKKFEQIPTDLDTQILLYSEMKFGEIDCLFQAWVWDSIQGNSLIFHTDDVKNRNDEDLKKWITSESEIVQSQSSINISRNPYKHNFVFVNFDFQHEEQPFTYRELIGTRRNTKDTCVCSDNFCV